MKFFEIERSEETIRKRLGPEKFRIRKRLRRRGKNLRCFTGVIHERVDEGEVIVIDKSRVWS